MRETVTQFTCDRCGQIRPETEIVSIKFWIGYCSGAVGQEDDVRVRDFCKSCSVVAFQRIVNLATCFEQAQQMFDVSVDKRPLMRVETRV